MRQIIYAIFGLLLLSTQGMAQAFINGDLEPVPTSTVRMCDTNGYMDINTMNGVYLATAATGHPLPYAYVSDDTCFSGLAEMGSHYMGLSYSPVARKSSRILLELTTPMQAMQDYTVTFYYKGPVAGVGSAAELEYGTTVDSLPTGLSDSLIDSIPPPAYDIWQKVSLHFSSKYASKYVWVAAKITGSPDTAITFIDDFSIERTGVNDPKKEDQLYLYPNPFTTSTRLILPPSAIAPYSISIHDMTGRSVLQESGIDQKDITINRSYLNDGLYILEVTDKNRKMFRTLLSIK